MNEVSRDTTPWKEFPRTVLPPPDGAYFRKRQPAKIAGTDEGIPPLAFPKSEAVS